MAHVTLHNGAKMPLVGLGTWQSKAGEVQAAVIHALKNGYRHIDCAACYGNETEVGEGLKTAFDSGVCKREDIFVTSKLWNTFHREEHVTAAFEKTLKDLQLDYIDLYLIHWPVSFKYSGDDKFPKNEEGKMIYDDVPPIQTWKAMEKLTLTGKVKSIGVSNFNSKQITEIEAEATIPIAVNQIESHPYFRNQKLIDFCQSKNIQVTAYCPLGSPTRPWAKEGEPVLLDDPDLIQIAKKVGKTAAQVLIRYHVDRKVVVIPKSVTPSRIDQNINIDDFKLSEQDFQILFKFNRDWRSCIPTNPDGTPRDAAHPYFPFHEEF